MKSNEVPYPRCRQLLRYVVITTTVLLPLAGVHWLTPRGAGDDFIQDYLSARAWLKGGDPYGDLNQMRTKAGFRPNPKIPHNPHPPTSIVLAAPVSLLPFRIAVRCYQVLQVVLLAITWIWTCVFIGRADTKMAIMGGVLIGIWSPVWQGLEWGQPAGCFSLVTVVLWALYRSCSAIGAGLAFAAATLLRPYYAFTLVSLTRRPMRHYLLFSIGVMLGGFVLFSVVATGPITWFRRASGVAHFFSSGGSLPMLLGLGFWPSLACFFGGFCLTQILCLWVSRDSALFVGLAFSLVFYPLAWFQYDACLIPVATWIVARSFQYRSPIARMFAYFFLLVRSIPVVHNAPLLQMWGQVAARVALGTSVLFLHGSRPAMKGSASHRARTTHAG